jgi:hypothetical protein
VAVLAPSIPLLLAACGSDAGGHEILGRHYERAMGCLASPTPLGEAHSGCDDSLTWAVDARGQCFLFTNGCLPPGFTVVIDGSAVGCPTTGPQPPACGSNAALMCPALQEEALAEVSAAVSSVRQCTADADCRPLPVPGSCLDCVHVAGNDDARAALEARAQAIAAVCGRFGAAGCQVIPSGCPPVAGWACEQGRCVPR